MQNLLSLQNNRCNKSGWWGLSRFQLPHDSESIQNHHFLPKNHENNRFFTITTRFWIYSQLIMNPIFSGIESALYDGGQISRRVGVGQGGSWGTKKCTKNLRDGSSYPPSAQRSWEEFRIKCLVHRGSSDHHVKDTNQKILTRDNKMIMEQSYPLDDHVTVTVGCLADRC